MGGETTTRCIAVNAWIAGVSKANQGHSARTNKNEFLQAKLDYSGFATKNLYQSKEVEKLLQVCEAAITKSAKAELNASDEIPNKKGNL